jgi:hypothetical protein
LFRSTVLIALRAIRGRRSPGYDEWGRRVEECPGYDEKGALEELERALATTSGPERQMGSHTNGFRHALLPPPHVGLPGGGIRDQGSGIRTDPFP